MRIVLVWCFSLAAVLSAGMPAGALELVPSATLYDGNRADVCFGDQRVYVASATGLEIFDISHPAHPVRSGQVIRTDGALLVTRNGMQLALATGSDSLIVYEINHPDRPRRIAVFAAHGRIRVLQSYGDHLYFADRAGWKRIRVRPTQTPLLDYVQTEHARIGALAFTGDSLYVVRADGLTLVYRVDPLPRLIDLYWSRTDIESFAIFDGYAYAAARDSGVFVYELNPVAGAKDVGRFYTYGIVYQLVADEGMLFVADRQRGLLALDLADPVHPFLVGSNDEPTILRAVRIDGGFAAGAAADGIYLFDVSDPYPPRTVGRTGAQYASRDVATCGNILYGAVDNAGLSSIDIANPEQPVILAETHLTDQILGLCRVDNLLAMACGATGLILADITNPEMPIELYRERTVGLAMDVAADDSLAIVADGSRGFRIFLIHDPPNSRLIGGKKTSLPVTTVARRGNYVYAAGRDLGLEVYDISNAFKPRLTYRFRPEERVYPLTIAGTHAYLGVDTVGLLVYDITSPAYPVVVDTVKVTRFPRRVIVDGALLYILDALEGVMLVDYRQRGAAAVILTTPLSAAANDFAFTGNELYVAGHPYLYTFRIGPPVIRGDVNDDGSVSMADIVYLVNYLFRSGPVPLRAAAGDLNGDGALGMVDLARLIRLVFP